MIFRRDRQDEQDKQPYHPLNTEGTKMAGDPKEV